MSEQKLSEQMRIFHGAKSWADEVAALEVELAEHKKVGAELLDERDEIIEDIQTINTALHKRMEGLEDALEHCGYDPTDCIDCGGPPHNEWCRFWKLRDILPVLFAAAEEEA